MAHVNLIHFNPVVACTKRIMGVHVKLVVPASTQKMTCVGGTMLLDVVSVDLMCVEMELNLSAAVTRKHMSTNARLG